MSYASDKTLGRFPHEAFTSIQNFAEELADHFELKTSVSQEKQFRI